jgi:non-specific serine/threonine protein kinase
VGSGGVGKTRLAVRVATDLQRAFPDGIWLVELASLVDAELVPKAVMTSLGLRDESTDGRCRG